MFEDCMRQPAKIEPWLTAEQMSVWLQKSPDESAHKQRMTIWLTSVGRLHAPKVAEILGVSVQSVWLWTRQYNSKGPKGLERKGRGGRRWAFMSRERETELLKTFIKRARKGDVAKVKDIRDVIEKELKRKVSMTYVYRLLARHGWSRIIALSQFKKSVMPDDFRKLSRPWLRK